MRPVRSRILDFRFGLCMLSRPLWHPQSEIFSRPLTMMPNRLLAFFFRAGLALAVQAASADEKPMMKAVVAHEYATPEVLKFEQVPRPELQDDEALVHAIAGGLNPADRLSRARTAAQ